MVLGGALIAFASLYVSTGFLRAELGSIQSMSSAVNATTVLSKYSSYADTGELISLAGAVVAPLGAAILAYGLSTGKSGKKEEKDVASELTQA